MSGSFKDSPEHEDWITETGGRDEDRDDYYQEYHKRTTGVGSGDEED